MAGMLPGVECARRRRLHHSAGSSLFSQTMPTHNSTRRSFCLYTTNLDSLLSSSSLLQRSLLLNQAHPDEKLGGAVGEAKQRLDEKFRAQRKSEKQRYNNNRKRKNLFHGLCQQLRSLVSLEEYKISK